MTRRRVFSKRTATKALFSFPHLALLLFILALPSQAAASACQVEVKCEQKRFEVKRSTSDSTETAEEHWGYLVTITNHSFKEMPDLRVEYIVFARHEKSGSTSEVKSDRTSGNKALGTLQNNGKINFETEQVTLEKARLKLDWYDRNGAKKNAKDELSGVWVRVYSGSELLNEFVQLATLKAREKWEG